MEVPEIWGHQPSQRARPEVEGRKGRRQPATATLAVGGSAARHHTLRGGSTPRKLCWTQTNTRVKVCLCAISWTHWLLVTYLPSPRCCVLFTAHIVRTEPSAQRQRSEPTPCPAGDPGCEFE